MNKAILIFSIGAFSLGPSIAHSRPTPITAGVEQSTLADAHVKSGSSRFIDIDFDEEFQVGTLHPMTVAAIAASIDGKAEVRAFDRGFAKWDNASAGHMSFRGGWVATKVTENGRASIRSPGSGQASWQYTFIADTESVFRLHWNIRGKGTNTEGLRGYELDVQFLPFHTMVVGTQGNVQVPLRTGITYTISVRNLAETNPPGQFEGMPLGDQTANIAADFTWTIEPL